MALRTMNMGALAGNLPNVVKEVGETKEPVLLMKYNISQGVALVPEEYLNDRDQVASIQLSETKRSERKK